jgi:hypothetical protein
MNTLDHLESLRAEARYRRERLALYRAKAYGGSVTSATRLRGLERASEFAEQSLRAQREPKH